MPHLLIVDDEPSICWGLTRLAQGMGLSVAASASAEQGLESSRRRKPDVLFLDIRLPGIDGLTAMNRFREQWAAAGLPPAPIIVMTAYGELDTAVEAVRNGAFDYLTKPFDIKVAQRVLERSLHQPEAVPPSALPAALDDPAAIVGKSAPMQEIFKRIALVAASEACVHLRGESGTGKELAARAIHRFGRRRDQPFVAVNVASLSPTLAESELFGHVRGAFTGADQPRKGLLEQADGGTLFLDEVADIPMPVQVKLLRALEHGEILPVGAEEPLQVDLRIISATHQDLGRRVAQGEFRHDLYFRLVTFEIEMPPLRERREDIRELAGHFVQLLAAKNHLGQPTISREFLVELERRPWHGNVRELRNAIEHAMILSPGGNLAPEYLPPPSPADFAADAVHEDAIAALIRQWSEAQLDASESSGLLYEQLLDLVEPPLLKAAAERFHGQAATAARRLGLHRTTLKKKWDRYGIEER